MHPMGSPPGSPMGSREKYNAYHGKYHRNFNHGKYDFRPLEVLWQAQCAPWDFPFDLYPQLECAVNDANYSVCTTTN